MNRPLSQRHYKSGLFSLMIPILDLSLDALRQWLSEHGQPAYRANQIRRWMFVGRARSFAAMTDLPAALRDLLTAHFALWTTEIARHQNSPDGTEKLLLRLADGNSIECVLLRDGIRRTICISSQVGCAMGCVFCASGLDGVKRNLTQGEILEQTLQLQHLLPATERLSHVVVMGMGEPLANLDHLLPALDQIRASDGLAISARRITISTVGLPRSLDRLAQLAVPYHLALSLHAPNDALRNELVPVNRKTGLDDILAAAERFFQVSGRRLTFEYVLLADLNDRPEHARELSQRLQGHSAMLNVIPYNPVAGLPYRTPSTSSLRRFCQILEQAGINVQVRERKGSEIDAACGQLRRTTEMLQADSTVVLSPSLSE